MKPTSRERFFFRNNLIILVKALEHHYTTIDLRNDISVCGKVTWVDGFMNIVVEDAVFIDSTNRTSFYESVLVRERNIRYVHVPEHMKIIPTIEKCLKDMFALRIREKIDSKKTQKAQQRHQATLKQLAKNK